MGITSQSHYSSFNKLPPTQRKKWDPISTLDILNPEKGNSLTCVGYAPSKHRRCYNPINKRNRQSAFTLLKDLSYVDVSTTDIEAELRQLAGLTLCLARHQNQTNDMVEQWYEMIDESLQPEEQWNDTADLLAQILSQTREKKKFNFPSPEFPRYQNKYDRRSTQEEQARKLREEEIRKPREREWYHQQQERRQREQKEKDAKARAEEREAKKREQEKERMKREEEEEERKKNEEAKRRKEEQQAKDREAREREERNERIRQRAEQARKDRERKAREQAAKEREEWDKVWIRYGRQWDDIKRNDTKATSEKLREIIPWPVKSGDWKDVSESAVEEFYQKAPPESHTTERMFDTMKMECLKWHADRIPRTFGAIQDQALAALFTTVAQVAIKIRAETARKRER